MKGRGFFDFIKQVGSFLKDTKLVSTIGNALGAVGVPFAGQIGSVAGQLGFGKRRISRRGGAQNPIGGAKNPIGMGRRILKIKRY